MRTFNFHDHLSKATQYKILMPMACCTSSRVVATSRIEELFKIVFYSSNSRNVVKLWTFICFVRVQRPIHAAGRTFIAHTFQQPHLARGRYLQSVPFHSRSCVGGKGHGLWDVVLLAAIRLPHCPAPHQCPLNLLKVSRNSMYRVHA